MVKDAPAFLSFREDIRNRNFGDWLEAHTSLMQPLHRYKGFITLDKEKLSFYGQDKETGSELRLSIYRYEIQQLYHGFDEDFTPWETRNLGLAWKPLRIVFAKDDGEYQIYLIINYSFGRCDNVFWMEMLKDWLG
jgi:hypothetical protein